MKKDYPRDRELGYFTMKKLEWISSLSLVALVLVSCTNKDKVGQAPIPTLSPETITSKVPNPSNSPNLSDLIVREQLKRSIKPTDPTKVKIPTGHRDDPFQVITLTPIPIQQSFSDERNLPNPKPKEPLKPAPQPNPTPTVGTNPPNPKPKPPLQPAPKPNPTPPVGTNPPNPKPKEPLKPAPQPNPTSPNNESTTPHLPGNPRTIPNPPVPVVPSTEIAKAVQVSGVMDVGGRLTAIVKESKENTSRSVNEGNYICDGAVRVKRIQLSDNAQPLVILEQNGVEVIKPISSGNGPIASNF